MHGNCLHAVQRLVCSKLAVRGSLRGSVWGLQGQLAPSCVSALCIHAHCPVGSSLVSRVLRWRYTEMRCVPAQLQHAAADAGGLCEGAAGHAAALAAYAAECAAGAGCDCLASTAAGACEVVSLPL